MEESQNTNTFKLQFISLYDSTLFHFFERVTKHLRESIYILNDEKLNGIKESVTLGDIIPEKYLSAESRHFVYILQEYSCVDEIILQLNQDIFGEDLTGILDHEIDIVVKFVYRFNPKN